MTISTAHLPRLARAKTLLRQDPDVVSVTKWRDGVRITWRGDRDDSLISGRALDEFLATWPAEPTLFGSGEGPHHG